MAAAAVSLTDYKYSVICAVDQEVEADMEDVAAALSDLMVSRLMISQLGQAINSGRSMFLFGAPGNGKTSIAQRAIRSLSEIIWIPRSITVGGEVIRLFDPSFMKPRPCRKRPALRKDFEVDERWIRIKRPTIVVGGELTLKHLEATLNPVTGIIEAPFMSKVIAVAWSLTILAVNRSP